MNLMAWTSSTIGQWVLRVLYLLQEVPEQNWASHICLITILNQWPLNNFDAIQQSPDALPVPVYTSTPIVEVTHHSHNKVIIESEKETYRLHFLIIMVI